MGRIGIGKEKGKFEVVSVDALNLDGSKMEIFNSADKILRASENRSDYIQFVDYEFDSEKVKILFETPVRIKENDKLSSEITFFLLLSRLSERAFLLSHLYCDSEFEDFKEFTRGAENVETISSKLRWIDWERYSSKQQTTMKFGGWVGDIVYKGDLKRFLPLLRFGQHIHVGKATTFGLGKYRIADL